MTESTVTVEITVKSVIVELAESFVSVADSGYSELSTSDRKKVRSAISARFAHLMRDGKFETAQKLFPLTQSGAFNVSRKRETVSNSDELRTVVRGMLELVHQYISGESAPNGIEAVSLVDEFDGMHGFEFTGEYDGEMPELSAELLSRLSPKRIVRNSPTNDVGELIAEAMSEFDVNEFQRVSDIRNKVRELHPELNVGPDFDGRINARLFDSETPIPNVSPAKNHPWKNGTRNGAIRVSDESPETTESDDSE